MEQTAPRPQDRFLRVGNIQARYWAEGEQGSPVVLIHGLGGYIESWWPNNMTLAREHRVYAVDLPGFGRSDKPAAWPYSLAGFVQFVHDFLQALGIDRASVAGHSLGGAIALQFTLTYPQMVDRLALVAPAGLGREAALMLRMASAPLIGEFLTRPSLSGSRMMMEELVYDRALITDADVQFDYEISAQPGGQQAFLKTLRFLGTVAGQKRSFYGPILEKLPTIKQPTLGFWGRDDKIVPVKHSEAIRRIPNAWLQIFERCGHIPQFEHPQAFDRAMLEFLCD